MNVQRQDSNVTDLDWEILEPHVGSTEASLLAAEGRTSKDKTKTLLTLDGTCWSHMSAPLKLYCLEQRDDPKG
jgi:hypothetical protein